MLNCALIRFLRKYYFFFVLVLIKNIKKMIFNEINKTNLRNLLLSILIEKLNNKQLFDK
jgi:hypothetical protein